MKFLALILFGYSLMFSIGTAQLDTDLSTLDLSDRNVYKKEREKIMAAMPEDIKLAIKKLKELDDLFAKSDGAPPAVKEFWRIKEKYGEKLTVIYDSGTGTSNFQDPTAWEMNYQLTSGDKIQIELSLDKSRYLDAVEYDSVDVRLGLQAKNGEEIISLPLRCKVEKNIVLVEGVVLVEEFRENMYLIVSCEIEPSLIAVSRFRLR